MSEDKHPDNHTRLPLPSPRPDAALDEKILAYARDNAPRRLRARPGPWLTGLATAGIVGVAVLISMPLEPPVPVVQEYQEQHSDAPAAAEAMAPVAKMSRSRVVDDELQAQAPARSAAAPLPAADKDESDGDASSIIQFYDMAATAQEERPKTKDDIAEELDALRQLLGAGETEQARALYLQLLEQCEGCELPDTLQQALQDHPAN